MTTSPVTTSVRCVPVCMGSKAWQIVKLYIPPHENRVFPSETDFGWKYAIFSAKILFILLLFIQIQQNISRKSSNSTLQYQPQNDLLAENEDSKSHVFPSGSCRTGDEQLSDSGRTAVRRWVGQLSADSQTAVCLRAKGCFACFSYRFAFPEGAICTKMKGWKVEKKPLFLYKYAKEHPRIAYLYTICGD